MGRYSREERSKFERKKRKDGFSCPTVSLMSIISDEMRRELMKFFFFTPRRLLAQQQKNGATTASNSTFTSTI